MTKLVGKCFFVDAEMFSFFQNNLKEAWIWETIVSDVQTYGEGVLNKVFTGLKLKNCLDDLADELIEPISKLDNQRYKEAEKIYGDFIRHLAHDKRALKNPHNDTTIIVDPDKNIDIFPNEPEDIEEVYNRSESYLSSLEKAALLYLKYKTLITLDTENQNFEGIDDDIKELILAQKEGLQALKHFTLQGIKQLANRAGLKMIFKEKKKKEEDKKEEEKKRK